MENDFSDMMNKFADMMRNSGSSSNNSFDKNTNNVENKNTINFDFNTFIKLKSVMDKMNSMPDQKENLLKSLKPYLRESRQSKIDQYINLFKIGKILDTLKQTDGDK